MTQYKYFYAKNLNRQSDCIISNPRIFKDKAMQVLLRKKIWIVKAIVSFQTPEFLKMKRYMYLYSKNLNRRSDRFKTQNLLAMKQYNYFCYYFLGRWGDSQI